MIALRKEGMKAESQQQTGFSCHVYPVIVTCICARWDASVKGALSNEGTAETATDLAPSGTRGQQKAGDLGPRLLRVAKRPRLASLLTNLMSWRLCVNGAAVLAMGFEPTRAEAQQDASLLRLPVSPRQHPEKRTTDI